jgi:hypothetical protein
MRPSPPSCALSELMSAARLQELASALRSLFAGFSLEQSQSSKKPSFTEAFYLAGRGFAGLELL